MIRLQFIEGLIALLPIVLLALVSILLRARAVGRQRRQEQSKDSEPKRQEAKQQQAASGAARPVAQTPAETAPAASQPRRLRMAKPSYRESYAYPPPLVPNQLKGEREAVAYGESPASKALADSETYMPLSSQTEIRRMRFEPAAGGESGRGGLRQRAGPAARETLQRPGRGEERARPFGVAAGTAAPGRRARSRVDKLNRLPPLQRAVVWAEILGPPGGRQQ